MNKGSIWQVLYDENYEASMGKEHIAKEGPSRANKTKGLRKRG